MRFVSTLKYLFIVSGLVMVTGAGLLYQDTQHFLYQSYNVEGRVKAFEQYSFGGSVYYRPVVEFLAAKGQVREFVAADGENPPAYLIGEKVEVVYLPGSTEQARINDFYALWGSVVLLFSTGAGFLIAGIGIGIFLHGKRKDLEYLKQHGTPVNAQFIAVEINDKLQINGKHPFRIQAMWQDPNSKQVYHFNSDNIWFDPSHYTKEYLTVLIDSSDPHKYYMDTSFLPKKLV